MDCEVAMTTTLDCELLKLLTVSARRLKKKWEGRELLLFCDNKERRRRPSVRQKGGKMGREGMIRFIPQRRPYSSPSVRQFH
jgi:hypothetical protein